jgi:hypothetical protein
MPDHHCVQENPIATITEHQRGQDSKLREHHRTLYGPEDGSNGLEPKGLAARMQRLEVWMKDQIEVQKREEVSRTWMARMLWGQAITLGVTAIGAVLLTMLKGSWLARLFISP